MITLVLSLFEYINLTASLTDRYFGTLISEPLKLDHNKRIEKFSAFSMILKS